MQFSYYSVAQIPLQTNPITSCLLGRNPCSDARRVLPCCFLLLYFAQTRWPVVQALTSSDTLTASQTVLTTTSALREGAFKFDMICALFALVDFHESILSSLLFAHRTVPRAYDGAGFCFNFYQHACG